MVGSDNETGFQIERSLTSGANFTVIQPTEANITSFTDSELSPNTVYYYRIRSLNGPSVSGYSNEVMITTPVYPEGLVSDADEIAALRELYFSLGGANWTNNTGWPSTTEEWNAVTAVNQVVGWRGITVTNSDVTKIVLPSNNLMGVIPSSIGSLERLTILYLHSNKLTGSIPQSLGDLIDLSELSLSSNPLMSGPLPGSFGNLIKLKNVWLADLGLTGTLPPSMSAMSALQTINLSRNQLTGEIGNIFQNSSSLKELWLVKNNFTGPIPDYFGNFTALTAFYVGWNTFTGDFPDWVGNLTNLEWFGVNDANFNEGSIPDNMGNLTKLKVLAINRCNRVDNIPQWIGQMPDLFYLGLSGNDITGQIPASYSNLANLEWMELEDTALDGPFPAYFTTFPKLDTIRIFNAGFDSFPDFSASPNRANLVIQASNNNFIFSDLEPNLPNGINPFKEFSYTPQKNPLEEIGINMTVGLSFEIINDRAGGANTNYQWQEWNGAGWDNIPGATDQNLTLNNVDNTFINKQYRCEMINTLVTDLTLYSSVLKVTGLNDPLPTDFVVKPLYNGNITSMKWASAQVDATEDAPFSGIYLFDYDNKYQLEQAVFGKETALGVETRTNQFRLNNLFYDANGNIKTLKRYDAQGKVLHNFDYKYNEEGVVLNNQLDRIPGHATYHYNQIGQLTEEIREDGKNKYMDYDVTGKVTAVYSDELKSDLKVSYTYDDRGFRLSSLNNETKITTWYIRDAGGNVMSIYEQKEGALNTLIQTDVPIYGSGRIGVYYPQQDGTTAYELTDHLGNVRAVVKRRNTVYTATMEDNGMEDYSNPRVEEVNYFQNLMATEYANNQGWYNHTEPGVVPDPIYSAFLNGTDNIIGPAITLRVETGDRISGMEAYGKFEKQTDYNQLALMDVVSALTSTYINLNGKEVVAELEDIFEMALTGYASGTDSVPAAYLNYILFDKDFNVIIKDRELIPEAAGYTFGEQDISEFKLLSIATELEITQPGYIYMYVSNESPGSLVWFDDISIVLNEKVVSQATDYYPFGMVMRRTNMPNAYFETTSTSVASDAVGAYIMGESPDYPYAPGTEVPLLTVGHDGAVDGAFAFNGYSTVASIPLTSAFPMNIRSTGIFSISAWIKNEDLSRDAVIIGNTDDRYYTDSGFLFSYLAGGQLQFMLSGELNNPYPYDRGSWKVVSDAGVITDNSWHHVAVTADRESLKFYVDGQPAGERDISYEPLFDEYDYWAVQIGAATTDYYVYGDHWLGALDDIMVFDRPLTPGEVALLAGLEPAPATEENPLALGKYYRYGYQGEFAEEDSETGWNSFELRMYDPVVGRWNTTDPMGQHWSPYLSFSNNPISRVDPDGGSDEWIPKVDNNGNTYYVAEAGDNLQTFMDQFNVSYDDALSYFGGSGYSGAEGPFSLASIKEGSIISAPFLQFNLEMTDGGWFSFDYWSKETQQRAIDHFGFALDYAKSNGFGSFKVGDIYNFNKLDFSGQTGFIFRGNMNMKGQSVPVTLDVVTMWNSIIGTSPTPKGVHNDRFINYQFNHPYGTYKGYIQVPSKYYDTANDYFFK